MRTSFKRLSALLLLALPAAVHAQYNFTTTNDTIAVTGYTNSGGDVTIPSMTKGYSVTSIGSWAFLYCPPMNRIIR